MSAPRAMPMEPDFPADSRMKILLVDDTPENLVSLEAALGGLQEDLVMAQSGKEALRHLLNDDFAAALSTKDFTNRKKNKYIDALTFIGPFAAPGESASRKKILICDPKSGPACVQKIIANLANHAYRRPATSQETAAILHFVDFARAQGQSVEQGIQLAIQAILVSPNFLFKIENGSVAAHAVSDYELASRLSYFLWSSMPDDELLARDGREWLCGCGCCGEGHIDHAALLSQSRTMSAACLGFSSTSVPTVLRVRICCSESPDAAQTSPVVRAAGRPRGRRKRRRTGRRGSRPAMRTISGAAPGSSMQSRDERAAWDPSASTCGRAAGSAIRRSPAWCPIRIARDRGIRRGS